MPELPEDPPAEPRPRRWTGRRVAGLVVALVTGGLLLGTVFWLADLEDVVRRLGAMSPGLLGLALLAYSTTYAARARRLAAAGARGSTWTLFWVVAVHGAANRVMPLKTGELVYPVLARRVGVVGLGEGVVQVLLIRIMDLLTVALLFLSALALSLILGAAGLGAATPAFVGAAAILLAASSLAFARLGPLLSLVIRVARRIAGRAGRLAGALDRADGAVRSVADLSPSRRARVVLWSVVCWCAYYATFHLILMALGVEVSVLVTVIGSSAAIVASVVPISGLGTFGALEGGWTAGFVAAGLETTTAASTAIVMSGVTLLFAVLLAAAGWVVLAARPSPLSPPEARRGRRGSP